LTLNSCSKIRDEGLKSLSKALQRRSLSKKRPAVILQKSNDKSEEPLQKPQSSNIWNKIFKCFIPRQQRLSSGHSYSPITNLNEAQLDSLQSLTLDFFSCKEITDQGVEDLSAALIRYSSLRSINLSFGYCDKITDRSFGNLGEVIQKLTSFNDIHLGFFNCGVSKNCANTLEESLKRRGLFPWIYC